MCDVVVHPLTCLTEWITKLLMMMVSLAWGLLWVLSTCVGYANLSGQYSKYVYLRISK